MGGVEHAGGLTFVGHVSHFFCVCVYCMHLSCEMLCGAGAQLRCAVADMRGCLLPLAPIYSLS